MLLTFVFLLLIASALAAPGCGHLGSGFFASRSRRAIIGGNEIKAEVVPWVVRVDIDNKHQCTGTLISARHVLTAAHCFAAPFCENSFRHGAYHICHQEDKNNVECSEDRKYPIKRVHLLEDYIAKDCNFSSDIVVLELEKSVPSASPVCLPFTSRELNYVKNGTSEVHLFGYSPNHHIKGEALNFHLQHGKTVASLGPWVNRYDILHGTFLASFRGPELANLCGGDSGGPMVEIHEGKAVLVGVNVGGDEQCGFPAKIDSKQYSVEVTRHLERIFYAVADKSDSE